MSLSPSSFSCFSSSSFPSSFSSKPWCCGQCPLDLEDCRSDHRSDLESLSHSKEDGSAACSLVELIDRACLGVDSEIAEHKQQQDDASTVSRFIDAFNSSWPGDDMCLIGRSLLSMFVESATVSLRSRIRFIVCLSLLCLLSLSVGTAART